MTSKGDTNPSFFIILVHNAHTHTHTHTHIYISNGVIGIIFT
jgi:hypothetical protein